VDAVVTYWPFVARLEVEGAETLIGIEEALAALGIEPAPALVGFLWRSDRLDADLRDGFLAAMREAQAVLAEDDAAWERIRPLMRAGSEAAFERLRAAYRSGIPEAWDAADTAAAERLHAKLIRLGGEGFAAQQGAFDPAVFHRADAAPDHDG